MSGEGNTLVRTFADKKVRIFIFDTKHGNYVAADQAGWISGSWDTIDAAMAAAKQANGI